MQVLTIGDRVQLKENAYENAAISRPIPGTWFEEIGVIKEFIQNYERQEVAALVRWDISGYRDIFLISDLVNVNKNAPYIEMTAFKNVHKVLYDNNFIPIEFYHIVDSLMHFENLPRAANILCSKTDYRLYFNPKFGKVTTGNISGETLTKIVVPHNSTAKEGCKSIW